MSDAAPHRSTPPAPSAIRPFDFPDVISGELDNGLATRIVRMPRLPLVSGTLVMAASEASLDRERAGLAVVAGDALEGGTGSRSGAEMAEALEGIGAKVRVSTGWDATTVSFSCLADRLPEAVPLLAELVRSPAFPPDEVERTRNQRLARIRQRAMKPSSLASDRAAELFYAEGVPYGRPLAGTTESVEPIDSEAVRSFAERFYRPGSGGIVVVGDVDGTEIGGLVGEGLTGWDGRPPERRDFEAEARTRERAVHVVHRPGSVQSEIRVGHAGVPKRSPDYFPLVVANTVLGGAFTSRLNLNLRERHGFTYGVRSRFSFRRQAGPFTVSTAVGTEVTADAVREIFTELETMVADGPTEEELQGARDYIAGVFPLRLETTSQVAARVAELIVYDLPDDWHAAYRDRIRSVERTDAHGAVRRHVRPDEAQVVIVGDADRVAGPLEALELGPVVVHERAG